MTQPAQPARFSLETYREIPIIVVEGEVDMTNVTELRKFLENSADEADLGVIVDLAHVLYLDSRTIAMLADFSARMRTTRERVALVAPPESFAGRVLRIAGLSLVIPTFAERDGAVEAVKNPS